MVQLLLVDKKITNARDLVKLLVFIDQHLKMSADNGAEEKAEEGDKYEEYEVEIEQPYGLKFAKGRDGATYIDVIEPGGSADKTKMFPVGDKVLATSQCIFQLDKRVRLTEKFNVGVSVVNEKVKSVDQKLQVSDKTTAAILAAERKLNDTGSAVKSILDSIAANT